MDIEARIRRRQRRTDEPVLVEDRESLSPVSHVDEPSDRGPVLERLLDHLDPVFDGDLPPDGHVHGPRGSGKSALLTALCSHLQRLPRPGQSVIHTTTRAQSVASPEFAYVDARESASEFALYRATLAGLVDEAVPAHGVGTDTLRDRLREHVAAGHRAVIVVDHVDEDASLPLSTVRDLLAFDAVAVLAVGRAAPAGPGAPATVEVPAYQPQALVDVVMNRAAAGLNQRALDHAQAQRIADWADGDAHDALAALFVAADHASRAGRDRIADPDVAAGIEEVPRSGVSLGTVLALPDNRLAVLRELVDLDERRRESVTDAAAAIAAAPGVDLSEATVERFLYELAESGVLERVTAEREGGQGRPPSRLVERFPPTVFRHLAGGR